MPNFTIRQIILTHQPSDHYGYWCMCGKVFSGEHQLAMLEADHHDTEA